MLTLTCPVDTPLHRWPAGLKLTLLVALGVALGLTGQSALLGLALAFVWAAHLVGGWRLMALAPRLLLPLWPFVLVVGGWHLWRGTPQAGAAAVLRMLTMLMAANLFTMTTRLDALISVFRTLASPLALLGIPTQRLALGLAMTVRFVPVLAERSTTLREAWAARAPRPARHRILPALAASALDEADHAAEALRARGGSD